MDNENVATLLHDDLKRIFDPSRAERPSTSVNTWEKKCQRVSIKENMLQRFKHIGSAHVFGSSTHVDSLNFK